MRVQAPNAHRRPDPPHFRPAGATSSTTSNTSFHDRPLISTLLTPSSGPPSRFKTCLRWTAGRCRTWCRRRRRGRGRRHPGERSRCQTQARSRNQTRSGQRPPRPRRRRRQRTSRSTRRTARTRRVVPARTSSRWQRNADHDQSRRLLSRRLPRRNSPLTPPIRPTARTTRSRDPRRGNHSLDRRDQRGMPPRRNSTPTSHHPPFPVSRRRDT